MDTVCVYYFKLIALYLSNSAALWTLDYFECEKSGVF